MKVENAAVNRGQSAAISFILLFAMVLTAGMLFASASFGDDAVSTADDAALKEVVAGFSNGWNTHDAHAMCASLADDVQWVNWRGEVYTSRKAVEDEHAQLFTGLYKETHRTDEVKSVHSFGPGLVSVDDYWSMTGARKRDGSSWPYRAGYSNFVMAKRNGRWIVISSHTADFNAKGPTGE